MCYLGFWIAMFLVWPLVSYCLRRRKKLKGMHGSTAANVHPSNTGTNANSAPPAGMCDGQEPDSGSDRDCALLRSC